MYLVPGTCTNTRIWAIHISSPCTYHVWMHNVEAWYVPQANMRAMWRVNRCLLCHESREGTGSTAILGERVRLGGSPNFEGVLVSPLRPVVGPAACFGGQTRAHDALEVADSLSGRLSANANENSHLRPLLSPPRGSLIPYLFIYLCFHANCRSLFALLVQPPSFRTYLRSTIGSHSRHLSPLLALYGARLRFLSRQESSIFFPRRLASNREYTKAYALCAVKFGTRKKKKKRKNVLGWIRFDEIDRSKCEL